MSDLAAPAGAGTAPGSSSPVSSTPRRRWFQSLAVEGLLGLLVVFGLLLLGIALLMTSYGKREVARESQRKIEEAGNRNVEELQRRSREIAALARTLGESAAALPKDAAQVERSLRPLVDFQRDLAVAGGGYWPEPGLFTPGVDRRSFFWGRSPESDELRFFDSYNQPPPSPGYHNEEWYVPARYLPPGQVFWSKSYQDPYTYQPMVTCTAGVFENGRFAGTATVNLKLEGLANLVKNWEQSFGGYGFLLDRNNKFLSFPEPQQVREVSVDEAGKRTEDFIYLTRQVGGAKSLVEEDPRFEPLAQAVEAMDQEILKRAKASPNYDPSLAAKIDGDSYQIFADEAAYIAAVLVDPLETRPDGTRSRLFSAVDIPADPRLGGEPAVAFLFNVPDSYWKLVQVAPRSYLEATATRISRLLQLLLAALLLVVMVPAYLFLSRKWIRPVTTLAQAATLVRDGDLGVSVAVPGRDELGELAGSFNQMVARLKASTEDLQSTNTELARTLAMTDTIMGTVREGLFLLNQDLTIEPKYSAALEEILGARHLAGQSFLDLIRGITPEKTHGLTSRFLKLLFNPIKNDSVVAKINPLKEVEASFPNAAGQLEQKYLTFTFDRIREGEDVPLAMVTVSDVTSRVLLARQLKESQQRMERQAELLLSVMHVEPRMLKDFVDGAHTELERINEMLKQGRDETQSSFGRQSFYRQLADQIFKSVHSIKGTASLLRIDYFAAAAHRFEDKLTQLRARPSLDGNDFVPIVLELSEMIDSLAEVKEVIGRFSETQWRQGASAPSPPAKTELQALAEVTERFVKDLAAKHGKQVSVEFRAPENLPLASTVTPRLRDVFAQLARNAVVHGIEPPTEREAAGKGREGSILVAARQQGGQLEFLFRDDGRGLDYHRVVERVRELAKSDPGLLDQLIDRQTNRWRPAALDEMIFYPGFSTTQAADEDAGRGFGMNAVRDILRELGGTIAVRHRPGQFCELRMVIPAAGTN